MNYDPSRRGDVGLAVGLLKGIGWLLMLPVKLLLKYINRKKANRNGK